MFDRLKKIEKNENSHEEIYFIIGNILENFNLMFHNLHRSYKMVRIRVNEPRLSFKDISDLSYKPKELNTNYQRCSIPFETMFYATSCERLLEKTPTDIDFGIKVALFETIPVLRDNCLRSTGRFDPLDKEEQFKVMVDLKPLTITYSIWEVKKTLVLVKACPLAIIQSEEIRMFENRYLFDRYIVNDYSNISLSEDFFNFLKFEFSRIGRFLSSDLDYMISAIASKHFCKKFDGVSYPCARCSGYGVNFAIQPNIVDSKMECVEIGEIDVFVNNNRLQFSYR
jgi:hypothetical protein